MFPRKLALVALLSLFTSCARIDAGGPESVGTASVTPIPLANGAPASIVREGRLRFEPALRTWAPEGQLPAGATHFQFLDGVTRELRFKSHQQGVFVGEVVDVPGSTVVLAHVDDAVAGTLMVPGVGLYRVRTRPGGELRLSELNADKIPTEVPPIVPPVSLGKAMSGTGASGDELGATGTAPSDPSAPPVLADTNTVVDIAIFYTSQSAAANGGASGVLAVINAAVATSNTAYTNSGVALTMRVVATGETAYSESNALATDLPRLANTSDGYMDEVHATRDLYKADIVSLVVSNATDAAGIGYLWTPGGAGTFSSYAFNAVVDDYADSNLTLAHEVGHNMGCGHAAGDGGSGAYSYSYGWKFTASGTAYRTVMAYAPGIRIPYFSNPNVNYLGTPTGDATTAYNALTLTNTKTTIAALRSGLSVTDQQWWPVTTGDFDADGKTDIIWRNMSSGRVIVWFMNGTTRVSTGSVWSGDAAWVPIASADFNSDGKSDLVWRNSSTGRVIVWLMNGTTMTSAVAIWSGDPNWVPLAAGDLNGDSKADLIWRNSATGRVIAWLMNGTTTSSTAALWTGDSAWSPIGTGDFNADGQTDIVWRNTNTGRAIVWYMNGTTMTSAAALWSGSTDWVPRAVGNMAGDTGADLIWRNSSTGRVLVWTMSGATMASATAIWE